MALQVGDTIAARLVATVSAINAAGITVQSFGGTTVMFPRQIADDKGFTWRKVASPEPAYEVGSLYVDGTGDVFLRTGEQQPGDAWQVVRSASLPLGQYVHDDTPSRPLKRLVPEA